MSNLDWTINGRFLTQGVTGVQRYAREIVSELDLLLQECHPLTAGLKIEIVAPGSARDLLHLKALSVRRAGRFEGHLWEQASLLREARGGIVNLCNTAPLLGRHNVVCIHDLNVRDYPESYSRRFRTLYNALIPRLARRAGRVTTVSHHSAARIGTLGVPAERIGVLPNGHEHVGKWRPRSSPKVQEARGANTVVVLGSAAPHKNIAMLLRLAPEMEAAGLKLAVVGGFDASVFAGTAPISGGNIVVTGRLSDDELAALLQDCLCLAFPSFIEGFGLPPLEAMALGCPVVSSNRTSLPEVGGDAVIYADPDDAASWLSSFCRLRDDTALREVLVAKGLRQAERFSWRQSALGYLKIMAGSAAPYEAVQRSSDQDV